MYQLSFSSICISGYSLIIIPATQDVSRPLGDTCVIPDECMLKDCCTYKIIFKNFKSRHLFMCNCVSLVLNRECVFQFLNQSLVSVDGYLWCRLWWSYITPLPVCNSDVGDISSCNVVPSRTIFSKITTNPVLLRLEIVVWSKHSDSTWLLPVRQIHSLERNFWQVHTCHKNSVSTLVRQYCTPPSVAPKHANFYQNLLQHNSYMQP